MYLLVIDISDGNKSITNISIGNKYIITDISIDNKFINIG